MVADERDKVQERSCGYVDKDQTSEAPVTRCEVPSTERQGFVHLPASDQVVGRRECQQGLIQR